MAVEAAGSVKGTDGILSGRARLGAASYLGLVLVASPACVLPGYEVSGTGAGASTAGGSGGTSITTSTGGTGATAGGGGGIGGAGGIGAGGGGGAGGGCAGCSVETTLFAGTGANECLTVVAEPAGVLLGGSHNGTVQLGPMTSLVCASPPDAFVARLDSSWAVKGTLAFTEGTPPGSQVVTGVARQSDGSFVVAGTFKNEVTLSPGFMLTSTVPAGFVALYSPTGAFKASLKLSGFKSASVVAVAVDSSDAVLVTGTYEGSIMLPAGVATGHGGMDGYVLKLQSDINSWDWQATFGSDSEDRPRALAVDSGGDVTVVGSYRNQMGSDDPGWSLPNASGTVDGFVARLGGADGKVTWAKQMSGTGGATDGDQVPLGVATDSAGAIYVAGDFNQGIKVGGGSTLTDAGGPKDLFYARLDALTGDAAWLYKIADAAPEPHLRVATSPAGGFAISGGFTGTVSFGGGGAVSNPDGTDVFFVRFDAAGQYQWKTIVTGTGKIKSGALTFDDGGAALLCGSFTGLVNFGQGDVGSLNEVDESLFLMKITP